MKLHFVGLPHTETTSEYVWCAYTSKLRHIGQVCKMIGIQTVLYGSSRDEGEFDEVVEVVTDTQRDEWFGHIDWNRSTFDGWDSNAVWWKTINATTIKEIQQRIEPQDAICIIAGQCQEEIVNAFPNLGLEWAIGYEGVLPNTHK